MPLIYTKEEIKEYLSDRGFDVSDEEVIKKFIHDLKKMIKYEDRQRRRVKLGHDPEDTNLESESSHATGNISQGHSNLDRSSSVKPVGHGIGQDLKKMKYEDRQRRRVKLGHDPEDTNLESESSHATGNYSQGHSNLNLDSSSSVKPVGYGIGQDFKKMKYEDRQRRRVKLGHDPESSHATGNYSQGHSNLDRSSSVKPVGHGIGQGIESSRSTRPTHSAPAGPASGKENDESHDETSELLYILGGMLGEHDVDKSSSGNGSSRRPILGPSNAVKRDPVALYYYYKKFWDKQSFPGENRHMKLRWNVRAQTVGNYPCIDGHPVKYLR